MPTILRKVEATLLKGTAKYEVDKRSASRVFYCVLDAAPADADELLALFTASTGIDIDDPLKAGDTRTLKTITPASLGTVTDYTFTLDYETPNREAGQTNPNPLMRPDDIGLSGNNSKNPYFTDFSSTPKAVTTSAGEPFQTLPENVTGEWEFVIKGNRASIDAAVWPTYVNRKGNAINSGSVTVRGITFPAGSMLMKSMRMAPKFENDVRYFEMEWTIAVSDTWDHNIEDRGFSYLVGGKPTLIMQDNGKDPIAASYPLDGAGGKKPNPTDVPATKTFKPQPAKDFSIFTWTSAA